MAIVYTHGTWIVKPGREAQFIDAWKDLGSWTKTEYPGAHGTLLRDRAEPNRFVSFGPWESPEAVAAWRANPGFQARVARIGESLESFEPRALDLVAEIR